MINKFGDWLSAWLLIIVVMVIFLGLCGVLDELIMEVSR